MAPKASPLGKKLQSQILFAINHRASISPGCVFKASFFGVAEDGYDQHGKAGAAGLDRGRIARLLSIGGLNCIVPAQGRPGNVPAKRCCTAL
jgi:hypothetical protein